MNIAEMHYDFKLKLNKIDSAANKNFRVPEIDWFLNEAIELFIKMVSHPRLQSQLGFEKTQRTIDDIKNVVVDNECIAATLIDGFYYIAYPIDYWYYLRGEVVMTKGECLNRRGKLRIRQHDDDFQRSPFDNSSFEWREVNALFTEDGIKLFTDNSFTITEVCLYYIREFTRVHNAQAANGGSYIALDGNTLTGSQDCDLSFHTHREIVDIAVMLASGAINSPEINFKLQKLQINNNLNQ